MKLLFNDGSEVEIALKNNPVSNAIKGMYRNLQYLPLDFKPWDNFYHNETAEYKNLVTQLIKFGATVNVEVNQQWCLDHNQSYFNDLHKIYEKNYNGNSAWLDFHESIHLCEYFTDDQNEYCTFIDYREKSGPLEKSFDPTWMAETTTTVDDGDVFVHWGELGKTPYNYWKNQEPNDIDRMKELIKPWLKLRSKLTIATADIDTMKKFCVDEFVHWWKDYEQPWCQHWKIDSWGIKEIASVSVVGKVVELDLLKSNLKNRIVPVKVEL
jgi:hypothetical protein